MTYIFESTDAEFVEEEDDALLLEEDAVCRRTVADVFEEETRPDVLCSGKSRSSAFRFICEKGVWKHSVNYILDLHPRPVASGVDNGQKRLQSVRPRRRVDVYPLRAPLNLLTFSES